MHKLYIWHICSDCLCCRQGQFRNSPYNNIDFAVTLPQGMDVCDIGTLTVWCQPFDAIFGEVEIPRSTFVSKPTIIVHLVRRLSICTEYLCIA